MSRCTIYRAENLQDGGGRVSRVNDRRLEIRGYAGETLSVPCSSGNSQRLLSGPSSPGIPTPNDTPFVSVLIRTKEVERRIVAINSSRPSWRAARPPQTIPSPPLAEVIGVPLFRPRRSRIIDERLSRSHRCVTESFRSRSTIVTLCFCKAEAVLFENRNACRVS